MSNFAETLEKYGQEKEALTYYKEALRVLGNDGPIGTKIMLLKKTAELCLKFEDVDQAIEYIKEAKNIIENANEALVDLPKNFKERIMYFMALCYHKRGEFQHCLEILVKIIYELEEQKTKLPLLSDSYFLISQILKKTDQTTAMIFIEKGIKSSSEIFGSGNYSTRRFVNLKETLLKEK